MWPKVFTQLVELLPHITRLIPMADLFFQTRTASEKANEAAITGLVKDVRGDLGRVTAAHDGLYRQLQDHSAQLADMAADGRGVRVLLDGYGERLVGLEKQVILVGLWVKAAFILLLMVLTGLVVLYVHFR